MRAAATISLSEAVEFINGDRGKNYPDRDAQKPAGHCLFLNTKNVRQGYFDFSVVAFIDEERHHRLGGGTLSRNDIIVTIRGTLGNTAIYRDDIPFEVVRINSAMLALRPRSHFDPDFIERYLRSSEFLDWVGLNQRGSAQPHLRTADIETAKLPLLSLPQQRRIVAKIDSLTGKSKRARDHLDHIPRLVEKYKQAVLAAAFRGDLTREWRSGLSVPDWAHITAGAIIEDIVAGKNLRCEERPPAQNENGVVKVSAVSWGAFNPKAAKTLPRTFLPPASSHIRSGDLLISRANTLELVGAVVIVKEIPPNLYLSDKVLRLDVADEDKPWLMWFLRSPRGREAIEGSATGNQLSMRNLSQVALRAIDLPWPRSEERNEIVRRIETAFICIDRLASEATSARKLIDRLDQTVLAKAFRGELVPQDPTDEPASVLLERIRMERDAAPKARRGRKAHADA